MDNFLIKFEVTVGSGKDLEMSPPHYYSSFYEAMEHYFLTFRDVKDVLYIHLQSGSFTKNELSSQATSYNENVIFCILGFHRFFELAIKDILRQINPFFAVKLPTKEKDFFAYMDDKISPEEIPTIEFQETIKRFKEAFNYYRGTEIYATFLSKYEEVITEKNLEALKTLANWRNRIMHNGSTLPNIFGLDYFVSQQIFPLFAVFVNTLSEQEKKIIYSIFTTQSGISVIDEILNVKLDTRDFESPNGEFATKILRLGHLKEIGRVSKVNNWSMRNNHSYYEGRYENPIGRNERFAASESVAVHYHSIGNCLCCGTKALVVYKQVFYDIFIKGNRTFWWLKCYNCDYTIGDEVADPFLFGFSKERLFQD
jgi:hypothetical protein